MTSYPVLLRFGKNTKGRDFVVGDIHGAYDTLVAALRAVNFNVHTDRLFCVGDLIDRGPQSYRVAKFLAQPFVFAIRGNHEDMLLGMHEKGEPDPKIVQWMIEKNGFGWWTNTPKPVQNAIIQEIAKLPLVIEIETDRGTVGLVHADVPRGMDWQTFVYELESGNKDIEQVALWGRDRIEDGNCEGVLGIDRVFVGHTVQWTGLNKLGNVYAIDTGAIFAELGQHDHARMTLANIGTQTAVLTRPCLPRLIDVFDAPSSAPFGKYAVDIFTR